MTDGDAHEQPANGDEALPELEERRYPSTIGGLFYLLVLAAMVTGLVITWVDDWRLGARVLGGGLLAAGALRLVLPERDAGMLKVRHRMFDVLVVGAMGAAIIWLAGDIPEQPL